VTVGDISAVFWAWPLTFVEEKLEAVATTDALNLLQAANSAIVT